MARFPFTVTTYHCMHSIIPMKNYFWVAILRSAGRGGEVPIRGLSAYFVNDHGVSKDGLGEFRQTNRKATRRLSYNEPAELGKKSGLLALKRSNQSLK